MRDTSAATAASAKARRPRSRERGASAKSERTIAAIERVLVERALGGDLAACEVLLKVDSDRKRWAWATIDG